MAELTQKRAPMRKNKCVGKFSCFQVSFAFGVYMLFPMLKTLLAPKNRLSRKEWVDAAADEVGPNLIVNVSSSSPLHSSADILHN